MSASQDPSSQQAIARWGINPMVPYLGGIATWFLANGLQFVMVPTLVIITLGGTAGDLAKSPAVPPNVMMTNVGTMTNWRPLARNQVAMLPR